MIPRFDASRANPWCRSMHRTVETAGSLPRHRESHMERKRTVTWQDPVRVGKASLSLAGAAFLRAIADRTLPPPPIAELMGFDIEEVGEGRVVFGVQPQEYHYNPIGVVHGGLAATLLDSALGCALPVGANGRRIPWRHCSTPPWDAPSIRSYRKGARTPLWSSR